MYDLSFFRKEGFQVLQGLIPTQTIDAVQAYLGAEADATIQELSSIFGVRNRHELSSHIVNFSRTEQFKSLERPLQMKLSGHFSLQARLSPHLLNVAKSPAIIELYKTIFPGHKPRLHMPPTARFVLPHNAFAGVPPHQDVSYNTHIDDFFVLWIPFCEITDTRGGVQVFKGTNQPKQIPLPQSENFWLEGIKVEGSESIHCTMQPGDALLLNKWIVHASMPNISEEIRMSTDFRFFHGQSDKHYFDYEQDRVIDPQLG